MTIIELVERMLLLDPNAKFSIWEETPPFTSETDPSVVRCNRFGMIVCWHTNNAIPCPSEEEISAVELGE